MPKFFKSNKSESQSALLAKYSMCTHFEDFEAGVSFPSMCQHGNRHIAESKDNKHWTDQGKEWWRIKNGQDCHVHKDVDRMCVQRQYKQCNY